MRSGEVKMNLDALSMNVEFAADIIMFWFGSAYWKRGGKGLDSQMSTYYDGLWINKWFAKEEAGDALDKELHTVWGSIIQEIAEQGLEGYFKVDDFPQTPADALAIVVLLDQFSRNAFRGSPGAWATDPMALKICLKAIEKGFDKVLPAVAAAEFYMPLLHSESAELQQMSIDKYNALYNERKAPNTEPLLKRFTKLAHNHQVEIRLFGRFPGRNEFLGRKSTPQEQAYLEG